MIEQTESREDGIYIGGKDFSNFLRAYIKGHRFLHGNADPKRVVVPRVQIVDKVLIEYEQKPVEPKSVRAKVDKNVEIG